MMTLLLYYVSHTFVNCVKKLFKSWVAIFICAMLAFALLGGIMGVIIGGAVDETMPEEPAYEEQIEDEGIPPETTEMILEIIVGATTLILVFYNFYTGDKNGSAIFTMPDVNFMFPAPIKPQSVLLFRVVLQMGIMLVGSLYLLFQLPNLILNVGLPVRTAFVLLLAWFFILSVAKLVSVWVYTFTATHTRFRKYIRPVAIAMLGLPVAFVAAIKFFVTYNWITALQMVFCSNGTRFLPCFGWIRGIVMSVHTGSYISAAVYIILMLLLCLGIIAVIWRMQADFYEDALDGAAKRTEQLEAAKNGKKMGTKPKKHKHSENEDALPASEIGSGAGAGVFFTKALYLRRRSAKFGISTTGVTYILICAAGIALYYMNVFTDVSIPAAIISIIVFFSNFGNPISDETACPFLILVPESPYKKIFASLGGATVKSALDLLPAFLISAICFKGSITITLLWYFLLVSLDFFCSATGLLTELALPAQLQKAIKGTIQIWLNMIAVMPGIILLSLGAIMNFLPVTLIITALAQFGVGALFTLISGKLLHKD